MKGLRVLATLGLAFAVAPAAGAYGQARAQQPGDGLDASYSCIVCHADKRRSFVLGVHSERGIRCDDCHGGNPAAFETAAAHGGDFRGAPGKREAVELCASCHSDPDRMRPFGMSTNQLAEFRASPHGQLLLGRGSTDAPSCTDCHDAHTILPPDDARSSVYPTAVAATCARCHQDKELMRPYGLRTDEAERYRESAHGVGLFEHRNFAAPTCAGCHGSHGALPPDVSEVADVCGRCHVLVRRTFDEGRHGRAALGEEAPACTRCHDNHGTEPVPPGRIEASCRSCHDAGSDASLAGIEIQRLMLRATEEIVSADEAIQELVRAGWRTADMRFRYRAALTEYRQMPLVQHDLDLERLEALGLRVSSVSRDIRAAAEVAAERRWERKLLLVPVWFLALAGIALAGFRLRWLNRGGPRP